MFFRKPAASPVGSVAALLIMLGCLGEAVLGQDAPDGQSPAASAKLLETEESESDQRELLFEEAWKEYLEIAISVAADLDSPVQSQAALIVNQHSLSDSRFDAPVRETLKPDAGVVTSDRRQVAAIGLLPHTTISDTEQVSLLLDLLIARSLREGAPEYKLLRQGTLRFVGSPPVIDQLVSRLSLLQETLTEELATRLDENEPPAILYAAAGLTGHHGTKLVPRLLAAAESDDKFVKAAIFQAVGRMLDEDRARQRELQRAAAVEAAAMGKEKVAAELQAAAAKAKVSVKTLEYARRIIQRTDTNGDGVLSKEEWTKMLVDPSAADTNKDGKITPEEYAAWMEIRARQ